MLKKVILFSLMLGMFFNASVGVYAEENLIATEDSKLISDDVLDMLNVQDSAEVLRIYNVPITFVFSEFEDIDSILMSPEVLGEYYAVKSSDNTYTYLIEEYGAFVPLNVIRTNVQAMQACETGEVTVYIATDVIVYNTYLLSGESSHMGTAIYYKTNKGDYVYFIHSSIGEYLFPIEAFCAYQRAILDEASQYPDRVGVSYSQIWDLSPYDFRSDSFNLNAEIPKNKDSAQENVSDASTSVDTTDTSKDNLIATGEQQRDETNSAKTADGDKNPTWIFATIGACLLISVIAVGVFWKRKNKV